MNSVVVRSLFSLIVPGGLVFLATALLVHIGVPDKSLSALVHIYPYAVAAAGILLGWRFNRSRLVFAIIVLTVADRALLHFAAGAVSAGSASVGVGRSVYNAVAFLLPLNLVVLSWGKERGIVTLRGMVRMGVILLQILTVFLICRYPQLSPARILGYSFPKGHFLARLPLALPAVLAFAAAFILLAVRFIRHDTVIENGFFWALLSVFFALTLGKIGPVSAIYFATAGLVLVISVIETSHTMAFRDELTGIPGRRALEEALLKLSGNYSVAMLDIDHFKRFNDRHGHDVGDQVLRMIASKLAKVSGGGKAFRYGGEEFTIVFPGRTASEVSPHLDRLRKSVAQTRFVIRAHSRPRKKPEDPKKIRGSRKRVKITISIGVAERNQKYAGSEQVIQAADKALYRAKKKGRNRIST